MYRVKNKIFTACPKCYKKFEIPIYICPKCREAHTNLIPNNYGIIKRTCKCGEKLPTTFLNGRNKLEAKCRNLQCGHSIEAEEATPICIPIIGGPSVGKTCYLFSSVMALLQKTGPARSWSTPFINQSNRDIYDQAVRNFDNGIPPLKTGETTPVAFNFFIKSKKWSPDKILYFYDSAGEAFHESRELLAQKFYDYLNGFIIVIDPFSIPQLVMEYEDRLKIHGTGLKAADTMLEDAFDRMLLHLEKNHNIKRDQQVTLPCALVINKIDAFDLEDRIGHSAVRNYMSAHLKLKDFKEAEDMLCKQQLKSWGLGNFLRKVDQKFKKHRFYTCSALGRIPGNTGTKFQPYRVVEPLLWLLEEANKDLKK